MDRNNIYLFQCRYCSKPVKSLSGLTRHENVCYKKIERARDNRSHQVAAYQSRELYDAMNRARHVHKAEVRGRRAADARLPQDMFQENTYDGEPQPDSVEFQYQDARIEAWLKDQELHRADRIAACSSSLSSNHTVRDGPPQGTVDNHRKEPTVDVKRVSSARQNSRGHDMQRANLNDRQPMREILGVSNMQRWDRRG
jgi:hypothetical protein